MGTEKLYDVPLPSPLLHSERILAQYSDDSGISGFLARLIIPIPPIDSPGEYALQGILTLIK